jgi:hypothetical protein
MIGLCQRVARVDGPVPISRGGYRCRPMMMMAVVVMKLTPAAMRIGLFRRSARRRLTRTDGRRCVPVQANAIASKPEHSSTKLAAVTARNPSDTRSWLRMVRTPAALGEYRLAARTELPSRCTVKRIALGRGNWNPTDALGQQRCRSVGRRKPRRRERR